MAPGLTSSACPATAARSASSTFSTKDYDERIGDLGASISVIDVAPKGRVEVRSSSASDFKPVLEGSLPFRHLNTNFARLVEVARTAYPDVLAITFVWPFLGWRDQ